MKKIFQIGLIAACALITFSASAQKFGYMNSAAILSLLPEVKQADATLEVTQKQYQEMGKKKVELLQTSYKSLQEKAQAGLLSPKQEEEEAAKLKAMESELQAFEQEMGKKIQDKRNELLGPILKKVNDAINAVAKENEYQFVFDAGPGSGILLYADESQDVTKLVMDKLGVKMPESTTTPATPAIPAEGKDK